MLNRKGRIRGEEGSSQDLFDERHNGLQLITNRALIELTGGGGGDIRELEEVTSRPKRSTDAICCETTSLDYAAALNDHGHSGN